MTLKKSFRNNAFLELLKFSFKKNLGFTLIASLVALLLGPFRLIRELFFNSHTPLDNLALYFDTKEDFGGLAIFMSLLCGAFLIFLILYNFSYLFKKNASDAFHSFPLKRSELVLSKFVPVFLLSLIPLAVAFVGEMMVFAACKIPYDLFLVLRYLAFIVSAMLMCGGFTLIFVICSGTAMDSVFFFAAIGGGLPIIVGLCEGFAQSLLYGYTSSGDAFLKIATYTSPYFFSGYNLIEFTTGNGLDFTAAKWYTWVTMAVLGVAFVGVSVLAYNHRKSEKAGEPYAFKAVPIIICFVVSFVSSIVLGLVFEGFDFSGTLVFWGFALFGALLSATIYGAVAYRGFKQVKKSLLIGGGAFLLAIVVVASFALDVFGFETRIPEKEQVKSVSVAFGGEVVNFEADELDLVIDLHNDFIEARGAGHQLYRSVDLTYALKDGSYLNRDYNITEEYGVKPLFAIYKSKTRLDYLKSKFDKAAKNGYVNFSYSGASAEATETGNYFNKVLTSKDFKTLFELYEKEIKNISFEEFKSVYTDGYDKEIRYIDIAIKDERHDDVNYYPYDYVNLYLYESMTETIAFVQALPNAHNEQK